MTTPHRTRSQQRRRLALVGVGALVALLLWPLPVLLLLLAAGGVFALVSGYQELRARAVAGRPLRGVEPIGPPAPTWAAHQAGSSSRSLRRVMRPGARQTAGGVPRRLTRRPRVTPRPSMQRPTSAR